MTQTPEQPDDVKVMRSAEEIQFNQELGSFSDKDLIDEIKTRVTYYHDMEYRFGCLLDHATGGMMSKTNYDKETMYAQVNEFVSDQCYEAVEEYKKTAKVVEDRDVWKHFKLVAEYVYGNSIGGREHAIDAMVGIEDAIASQRAVIKKLVEALEKIEIMGDVSRCMDCTGASKCGDLAREALAQVKEVM